MKKQGGLEMFIPENLDPQQDMNLLISVSEMTNFEWCLAYQLMTALVNVKAIAAPVLL